MVKMVKNAKNSDLNIAPWLILAYFFPDHFLVVNSNLNYLYHLVSLKQRMYSGVRIFQVISICTNLKLKTIGSLLWRKYFRLSMKQFSFYSCWSEPVSRFRTSNWTRRSTCWTSCWAWPSTSAAWPRRRTESSKKWKTGLAHLTLFLTWTIVFFL
jgi:hypothetical protein